MFEVVIHYNVSFVAVICAVNDCSEIIVSFQLIYFILLFFLNKLIYDLSTTKNFHIVPTWNSKHFQTRLPNRTIWTIPGFQVYRSKILKHCLYLHSCFKFRGCIPLTHQHIYPTQLNFSLARLVLCTPIGPTIWKCSGFPRPCTDTTLVSALMLPNDPIISAGGPDAQAS